MTNTTRPFHFKQEKDRFEPPDDLTLSLSIDDKILKDIFKSLYYPESPYEFSVLPADIPGRSMNSFWVRLFILRQGIAPKWKKKPEVRKKRAAFITPRLILLIIL